MDKIAQPYGAAEQDWSIETVQQCLREIVQRDGGTHNVVGCGNDEEGYQDTMTARIVANSCGTAIQFLNLE